MKKTVLWIIGIAVVIFVVFVCVQAQRNENAIRDAVRQELRREWILHGRGPDGTIEGRVEEARAKRRRERLAAEEDAKNTGR